jgi:hypothetical protein
MHHERLKQFRCRSVEKAREVGLPAYFLDELGGVVRVLSNGRKERIVVTVGQPIVQPISHTLPVSAGPG